MKAVSRSWDSVIGVVATLRTGRYVVFLFFETSKLVLEFTQFRTLFLQVFFLGG